MSKQRKGDWFQTYTGTQFWPLDPVAEEIHIEDIAHSLANICRFNGHSRSFYSVAQHSVIVSRAVPEEQALWGLLHDASEAYLCDLVRPIKRLPEFAAYLEIEARLMRTICDRFNLPHEMPADVKKADNRVLFTEKRDLCTFARAHWDGEVDPYSFPIEPMGPGHAERDFMGRFWEIVAGGYEP